MQDNTRNFMQDNTSIKQDFWKLLKAYRKQRSDQIDAFHSMDEAFETMREKVIGYKGQLKFGLDFHGVIDRSPDLLSEWSEKAIKDGHQVHIMTGNVDSDEFRFTLRQLGFKSGRNFTHIYSITKDNINKGYEVVFDEKGRPFMDASLWNRSKGDYAASVGITALWDDSPVYGRYFPSTSTYLTFSPDNFLEEARWLVEGRPCLVGRK
jgi:hypothetical protein